MNGLVPELLAFLVQISGVFTLLKAATAVGWPALVSVASGGSVKEMAEGVYVVVHRGSSHPITVWFY